MNNETNNNEDIINKQIHLLEQQQKEENKRIERLLKEKQLLLAEEEAHKTLTARVSLEEEVKILQSKKRLRESNKDPGNAIKRNGNIRQDIDLVNDSEISSDILTHNYKGETFLYTKQNNPTTYKLLGSNGNRKVSSWQALLNQVNERQSNDDNENIVKGNEKAKSQRKRIQITNEQFQKMINSLPEDEPIDDDNSDTSNSSNNNDDEDEYEDNDDEEEDEDTDNYDDDDDYEEDEEEDNDDDNDSDNNNNDDEEENDIDNEKNYDEENNEENYDDEENYSDEENYANDNF